MGTKEETQKWFEENKNKTFKSRLTEERFMTFRPVQCKMHDFGLAAWYPVIVFERESKYLYETVQHPKIVKSIGSITDYLLPI